MHALESKQLACLRYIKELGNKSNEDYEEFDDEFDNISEEYIKESLEELENSDDEFNDNTEKYIKESKE